MDSRIQERENPSSVNSSNGTSPNSNSNGSVIQNNNPTPPLTPRTISRSDTNNPYPTTFVQADTSSFKQVVQMLTGSTDTAKQASNNPDPCPSSNKGSIPPIKTAPKKPSFKLYERRNSLKNGFKISPLIPGLHHHHHHVAQNSTFSPRAKPEILSPSILDFPSLVLSPVTPLNIEDPFNRSSPLLGNASEEDRAIAEKKFYLHPSPRRTPRDSEPQLLPLFPVTSPRVSGSSST